MPCRSSVAGRRDWLMGVPLVLVLVLVLAAGLVQMAGIWLALSDVDG